MYEIIRHGDPKYSTNIVRHFKCKTCGCEFRTDDYKPFVSIFPESDSKYAFTADCPDCKHYVFSTAENGSEMPGELPFDDPKDE